MCGIAGIAYLGRNVNEAPLQCLFDRQVQAFTKMLLKCEEYGLGRDATGLFIGNRPTLQSGTPEVVMHKDSLPAKKYMENMSEALDEKVDRLKTLYIVGHVRAATSGDCRNNNNNHPFHSGDIIGIHNGIISNYRKIASELFEDGIQLEGQCDSEVIFALLDSYMLESRTQTEAIEKTCKALTGWLSCVAVDITRYNQLLFFRKGGPLSMFYNHDNHFLMFASKESIIKEAIEESGLYGNFTEVTFNDNTGLIVDTIKNASSSDFETFDMNIKEKAAYINRQLVI